MPTSIKKQKLDVDPQSRLLSLYDVASILQIRHETARDWVDEGRIPHVRLSVGTIRVRREALEQFILSLETVGKDPDAPKRSRKEETAREAVTAR